MSAQALRGAIPYVLPEPPHFCWLCCVYAGATGERVKLHPKPAWSAGVAEEGLGKATHFK